MAVRSDVGFCCTTRIANEVKDKFPLIVGKSKEILSTKEGSMFYFEKVMWYPSTDEDLIDLYEFLDNYPEEEYLIVEACLHSTLDDYSTIGAWEDNPWKMHRYYKCGISFNQKSD